MPICPLELGLECVVNPPKQGVWGGSRGSHCSMEAFNDWLKMNEFEASLRLCLNLGIQSICAQN